MKKDFNLYKIEFIIICIGFLLFGVQLRPFLQHSTEQQTDSLYAIGGTALVLGTLIIRIIKRNSDNSGSH